MHLPQDTHIPERAVMALPAQHRLTAATQRLACTREGEPPLRPLRLFERPEQIKVIAQVPDGPPPGLSGAAPPMPWSAPKAPSASLWSGGARKARC